MQKYIFYGGWKMKAGDFRLENTDSSAFLPPNYNETIMICDIPQYSSR